MQFMPKFARSHCFRRAITGLGLCALAFGSAGCGSSDDAPGQSARPIDQVPEGLDARKAYVDCYVNSYNNCFVLNLMTGGGFMRPQADITDEAGRQLTEQEDVVYWHLEAMLGEGDPGFTSSACRSGIRDWLARGLPEHYIEFDPQVAPIMSGFRGEVEALIAAFRGGELREDELAMREMAAAQGVSVEQSLYFMVLADFHKRETGVDLLGQ